MAGHNYFLLASLPSLGDIGSQPPLSGAELLEQVRDAGGPLDIVEAIFLGGDLVLREAFLGGEVKELDGLVVLSPEQGRNEAPLPDELCVPAGSTRRVPVDDLWERYFEHVAAVARRTGCSFLGAWVGFEVALRNALAAGRAKALELDPADYLVAVDRANPDEDVNAVVAEWSAAPTPLAGLRALDAARWSWLRTHDGWFTFRDDEVAAYAAKTMVLDRWARLARAEAGASEETAPAAP
jgi:hypothetical protein